MPSKPGVYLFRNKSKKIIYIGKAKDLKNRVSSYFTGRHDTSPKTEVLVKNTQYIDYVLVNSEIEAFLLEANLIKKHKPFYNIKFSDDKYFPYIQISKSGILHVSITRKKNNPEYDYFGPYPDASSVKTVLKIMRRIFPYQSVRNHPKRICLYNHLKLCPCIPVYPENIKHYKSNINKIKQFLSGKIDKTVKDLEKERDSYTMSEEYELSKMTQEKLNKIILVTSPFYSPFNYENNPDLYYSRITAEINSLKQILTKYYPSITNLHRIECYDISNIQGTSATGSMVVFIDGEASKSHYRRFKIRSKSTPDDYMMMKEVLTRRLKHTGWEYPDLLVVDGGKGQVKAVLEVLSHQVKILPLIGLAKREEIIIIPDRQNGDLLFYEEKRPLSTPGLNLLRRLRDEAHRFAITYHRLLRKKRFLQG